MIRAYHTQDSIDNCERGHNTGIIKTLGASRFVHIRVWYHHI